MTSVQRGKLTPDNLIKPDIETAVMLTNVDILTVFSCVREGERVSDVIKKGSTENAALSTTANGYQPFGSMPNRSNSLRPSVLSQLPRLIFSAAAADSNCALSSGVRRTLNIGERPEPFGTLSLSMIDMYRPIEILSTTLGLYHNTVRHNKETPLNGITSTRQGLTTSVIKSNEEAMKEHTTHPQGRHSHTLKSGTGLPSFVWLIAAVRRDCPDIKATIHHIDAVSEQEAHRLLARDHVTYFAGRIRQEVCHA